MSIQGTTFFFMKPPTEPTDTVCITSFIGLEFHRAVLGLLKEIIIGCYSNF